MILYKIYQVKLFGLSPVTTIAALTSPQVSPRLCIDDAKVKVLKDRIYYDQPVETIFDEVQARVGSQSPDGTLCCHGSQLCSST